jgi:hypothetical protein
MIDKKAIKVEYKLNNEVKHSFGAIEIVKREVVSKEGYKFYVRWQVTDQNNLNVAGKIRMYYFILLPIDSEVYDLILIDIRNYKINRRIVFEKVEIT